MRFGQPVQLGLLGVGQIGRVAPQRPAGFLQRLGLLRGLPFAAAGGVPRVATDLVEGLGGPGDHMKRVRAAHRVRTAFGDHRGDPVRAVGGHVGDLPAALGAQGGEEPAQRLLVPAGGGPDQVPGVMVDHDGQVQVAALV